MIEINEEKKILFLEAFTKELIKSSFKRIELFRIKKLIEDKDGFQRPEERIELVKKIVESKEKEREGKIDSFNELSSSFGNSSSSYLYKVPLVNRPSSEFVKKADTQILNGPKVLKVPERRLPPRLSYLTPIKTNEEIDLGKLNPFVRDSNVISIEIEGPNKNIFVSGKMGTKKTGIILTKDEIDKVINDFSIKTKIPVSNGVNKMAFGKLILNAIVSDKMDKRLSLKKIADSPEIVSNVGFVHKRRVF